ncbi:MAG: carboxypeptidase M32 [Candidatus Hydrogenedentota bacterium]
MSGTSPYEQIIERLKVQQHYGSALSLLEWDQETYMPDGGAGARAELCSALSGIAHEYGISREMEKLFRILVDPGSGKIRNAKRLGPRERAVIRETFRRFRRNRKIPAAHVAAEARATSLAHQAWTVARRKSDFRIALPHLETIIDLKRRECEYVGYDAHPYDALLDVYEPHARTSDIDRIFGELKNPLTALASRLHHARPARILTHSREFEAPRVREFCEELLSDMGFDFNRGRMDESVHPFSTMMHPHDVRMTVRRERSPIDQILSTLHEGGHSLYSQGLEASHWGTPLAEATSLGIHESQSRLWENQVGRSRPFWTHYFPRLRMKMPRTLARVELDDFLREINRVSFSFIRVEADEVTYGLHVILRFEMEKALLDGSLQPKDVPAAWNEKMERYLGIRPKTDAQGCLQDVHWFTGNVGYFPTYVLGNLYGAQFYRAWKADHPRWKTELRQGRLTPLLAWLRENIHAHGSRFSAAQLVKRVTGETLRAKYFLDYLAETYGTAK